LEIDNFIDLLDEIKLPVHIKEAQDQPNFDATNSKTLSELEEDLDNLLEVSRHEAIIDREVPVSESLHDPVQTYIELVDNMVSPITTENCLKNLMAIPRLHVDNSELLGVIDHVSNSLSDCINFAETSLRERKSTIKREETSPQSECTGDIFSGLDRIDDKIAYCIKLAEDTLNSGRSDEQEHSGFTNLWATEGYNPQIARTDNAPSEHNSNHSPAPLPPIKTSIGVLPSGSPRGILRRVVMSRDSPRSERDGARNTRI